MNPIETTDPDDECELIADCWMLARTLADGLGDADPESLTFEHRQSERLPWTADVFGPDGLFGRAVGKTRLGALAGLRAALKEDVAALAQRALAAEEARSVVGVELPGTVAR